MLIDISSYHILTVTGTSMPFWSSQEGKHSGHPFLCSLTIFRSPSWHPINVAWLGANQKTPRRRAIAIALYMAMVNLSGVPASHIFNANDGPRYHKGFKVLFALAAVAIGIIVGMRYAYVWLNKRIETGKDKDTDPDFRYQL
jgi:hypothetical protein